VAKYLVGDMLVMLSMRLLGRLMFLLSFCWALVSIALVLMDKDPLVNFVIAMICSGVAYVTAVLMARYEFGLFWHRHVARKK